MEFDSFLFLIFLIVVTTFNYFSPQSYRPSLLLFASCIFITCFSLLSLFAVLVFSIFNFQFAKNIPASKNVYFILLFINISSIVLFNYFSISQQHLLFNVSAIRFDASRFVVALGLSFYSLQNIGYITDIYFKRMVPCTSLLNYVLSNSFFPKVASGPILSPNELVLQIPASKPNAEMLSSGINRFLVGLLKKMVIADRLSPAVNAVFDSSYNYNGCTTLAGVYLFTIQLYFDFSGYSDMAVGAAKMLGYELKENFNIPFRSTSVTEFWRRWHMSLIDWFTNYIYYPIVYRLRSYNKTAVFAGIAITFIISAIWHCIGFTFLLWGICHVIYMSIEFFTKSFRTNLSYRFPPLFYKLFSVFVVFNAVCFSNIFFRSHSIARAFQLINNIGSNFIPVSWLTDFVSPLAKGGTLTEQFNGMTSLMITLMFLLFEPFINRKANETKINIFYVVVCVLLIMLVGVFGNSERFIYMQF